MWLYCRHICSQRQLLCFPNLSCEWGNACVYWDTFFRFYYDTRTKFRHQVISGLGLKYHRQDYLRSPISVFWIFRMICDHLSLLFNRQHDLPLPVSVLFNRQDDLPWPVSVLFSFPKIIWTLRCGDSLSCSQLRDQFVSFNVKFSRCQLSAYNERRWDFLALIMARLRDGSSGVRILWIPVAELSKARVCGRLVAVVAGSNPAVPGGRAV